MLLRQTSSCSQIALADVPAQLRLLAETIESVAAPRESGPSIAERDLIVHDQPSPVDDRIEIAIARQLYTLRRRRVSLLGDQDLFGEPAWDVLLDLYIAAQQGKRVPVTSACIGAAVPPTTALRWLNQLEQRGLIEREHDPRDARRTYVRLSAMAESRLGDWLRLFAATMAATLACEPVQAERRPKAEAPA